MCPSVLDDYISHWIDNVVGRPSPIRTSRKRRRSSPSQLYKRCRLPTPDMEYQTPSKRPVASIDQADDETPRASRPVLSPKKSRSSASRSSTTTSSSRSPIKSMLDLSSSAGVKPIGLEDIFCRVADVLGRDARDLLAKIPKAAASGLIPSGLKNRVKSLGFIELLGLSDPSFSDVDGRLEYDINREFDDILDIVNTSRAYEKEGDFEASWNDGVHSHVLRVALRDRRNVGWRNVTKAMVYPQDLIPRLLNAPAAQQTNMVDYAIFLDLDDLPLYERLWDALEIHARNNPGVVKTVNATAYEPLRMRPIAINIETKRPYGDRLQAEAQAFSWTSFQMTRFNQFTTTAHGCNLLPQPVIVVVGTSWDLYFVSMDGSDKFKMYGPQPIGGTKNIIEVYRLLRSLRALADWSTSTFLSWWDSVLPVTE